MAPNKIAVYDMICTEYLIDQTIPVGMFLIFVAVMLLVKTEKEKD